MEWLIGLAAAIGTWLLVRHYSTKPEFPPLATEPDDPTMTAARAKARATLERFRSLYPANRESALAKIRFVTSSGTPEYLWGEVKNIEAERVELFLVTPPVTHEGSIERLIEVPFADLEDWQITDSDGRLHGGFTQRAMIEIAKRRWGKLPEELRKLEQLYAKAAADAGR